MAPSASTGRLPKMSARCGILPSSYRNATQCGATPAALALTLPRRLGCFVILRESKALLGPMSGRVHCGSAGVSGNRLQLVYRGRICAPNSRSHSAFSVEVRDFEEEIGRA